VSLRHCFGIATSGFGEGLRVKDDDDAAKLTTSRSVVRADVTPPVTNLATSTLDGTRIRYTPE